VVRTILSFAFELGVLVFVHELGHFLAAKRVGIHVLTFSLGFGPKLVKVQRGDTEYCISILPLGGYVKMAGDAEDSPRTGAPDEFLSKTKWQRFQVLIMGPVMNVLLAIVILTVVFTQANEIAKYSREVPKVGVVAAHSKAEQAGFEPGDVIVAINGQDTKSWQDYAYKMLKLANTDVDVTFERDGKARTVQVRPEMQGADGFPDIGVQPDVYPYVQGTVPGEPAEKAGVLAGDVVQAVDGVRMVFPEDLRDAIAKKPGTQIDLTILRNGATEHIRVTPVERDGGKIGIRPAIPTVVEKLNVIDAFTTSLKVNYQQSGLIFSTLKGLFTGRNSIKQLQGPIRIAQMSGEAIQVGYIWLFQFMAMLSLNLGLLNLLPVPILDGGHILIMAIEGIARRDFSMQVKERMLMAGFVVLMMLMVTVFYNDLAGLGAVQHLMKWRN
jgi:regulator of sigma E protease